MVPSSAGAVVLVRFPFSDLSGSKLRPAVALAAAGADDWVLCQVTSNPCADLRAVQLDEDSFAIGSLQRTSFARPGKLFTANASPMAVESGHLTPTSFSQVLNAVIGLLRGQGAGSAVNAIGTPS